MAKYVISKDEEKKILEKLDSKQDAESARIKRYLAMPDLTQTENSPIHDIVERIISLPDFKKFDTVKTLEIIDSELIFKLFNYPADHPERSPSNTYYIDKKYILRPLTTIMWHYYLELPEIKKRLEAEDTIGFFSFGKVYRKDEIDRNHMNVFHQMDGGFLIPKSKKTITIEDLKLVLSNIAKSIFGPQIKYRFNVDKFPYTDPSLEMEVDVNGRWVEVLGCGIMTDELMKNLGLDPTKWSNWAFGFGLERLAIISMELPDIRLLWSEDPRVINQLRLGNKYNEVSKFPPIVRDISFVVKNDFIANDYFDIVRETTPGLVEEVTLLDKYENEEKFGKDNVSYAFRITYRSLDRTLTAAEIDAIHKKLEGVTKKVFGATVR